MKNTFELLLTEYTSYHADKFKFIESYVNLILLTIKRFSADAMPARAASEQNRHADVKLVARYQSLIETRLSQAEIRPEYFGPSYYADQLHVHPNHLNAITKRLTGHTAKQVIQEKVALLAKSLLAQSDLSIKEIAYRLGYDEATHFSSFFKKATSLTPQQYRCGHRL